MTRLAIAAALIGVIVFYFVSADRDRRELQDARDHIEGAQDANEAERDVERVGAGQWLRDTFGGQGDSAD